MNGADTVTTIAVGLAKPGGAMLHPDQVRSLRAQLRVALSTWGRIVCEAEGLGITSDQAEGQRLEPCIVWIVTNARQDTTRAAVAHWLDRFGLSSACFAVDHQHTPARPPG